MTGCGDDNPFEQIRTFNSQDDLILKIDEMRNKPDNEKKSIYQLCLELGLKETVNLFDDRTEQLFDIWMQYRYAPHLIDSIPFVNANKIFNMTLGQRIG